MDRTQRSSLSGLTVLGRIRAFSRRKLLHYFGSSAILAGSAALEGCSRAPSESETDDRLRALIEEMSRQTDLIAEGVNHPSILPRTAREAASAFELRAVAEKNIPIAHFQYIEAAAGGGETARANEAAFKNYTLRSRRLHGVEKPDLGVEIFGERWRSPVALAPAGSQKAFHQEGEIATAHGAKDTNSALILSTLSTVGIEDVAEARGAAPWFQLYVLNNEDYRLEMLERAHKAGANVVVVTVDDVGGRGSENFIIGSRSDTRDCSQCHDVPRTVAGHARRKPMVSAFADEPGFDLGAVDMNWDFLARLRDAVPGKLVVKGILDPQDAERCVSLGADGIIVSNHGGRVGPNGEASLTVLPEVVRAVGDKVTILMDSGIRRGSDVFTALALGAHGVCIGRPYLWGLGAFGAEGVSRVIDLLNAELRRSMIQAGVAQTKDISDRSVRKSVF